MAAHDEEPCDSHDLLVDRCDHPADGAALSALVERVLAREGPENLSAVVVFKKIQNFNIFFPFGKVVFFTVACPWRAEDLAVAALELNGDDPGGVDLVVRLRALDAKAAGEIF